MQSTIDSGLPAKRYGWTLTTAINWSAVRFYRKRWFVFVFALLFAPVSLLVMATGGVYFERNGGVYAMPRSHKIVFLLLVLATIGFNLSHA